MFLSVVPCLMIALLVYCYGLFTALFSWGGLEEHCVAVVGVPLQPGYGEPDLFPPSRTCDAQHDTVPALVNPLMLTLAVSAVLMVLLQLVSRDRDGRSG